MLPSLSPSSKSAPKNHGCLPTLALPLTNLLVLLLPLTFILFNCGQVAFNSARLKRLVTEELLDPALIPAFLARFAPELQPEAANYLTPIDFSHWQIITAVLFPAAQLEEWATLTIDSAYQWLDSSSRLPRLDWDLRAFKNRVNTAPGEIAAQAAYAALKPCAAAPVADFQNQWEAAPPGTEIILPPCALPAPWAETQRTTYLEALRQTTAALPDHLNLTEKLAQWTATSGGSPELFKQQLRATRQNLQWVWLTPPLLLFLILILAVRSFQDLSRWWGQPLLIGGLLTLPLAFGWQWGLDKLIPNSEAPLPQAFRQTILHFATAIFQPLLPQALITISLGALLLGLGYFLKKHAPPGG